MDIRQRNNGERNNRLAVKISIGLAIIALAAVWRLDTAWAAPPEEERRIVTTLSIDGRLRNTFRSHTSYEFGNPLVPGHTPLSRLEFPLNAWWGGVGARGGTSRLSMGIEVLRSVTGEAGGYQIVLSIQ